MAVDSQFGDRVAWLAAVWLALAGTAARADGTTWIEQSEAALTCTALSDPGEAAQLAAPSVASPTDARYVRNYLGGTPTDARQARYRHLLMLSAVAWWADLVNDQAVRADALLTLGVLANAYAGSDTDLVWDQIARCARAQLISAELELDHGENVAKLTSNLLQMLPARLPARSVEDGPLLVALRDIRHAPRSHDSIVALATRAITYGDDAASADQPRRASRLLASAADALQALGYSARAQQLAMQSMLVTGKPPAVDAAWRAMPALYDAAVSLHGAADAANLQLLLKPDQPPTSLDDRRVAFESLLRLSKAADTKQDFDTMGRLQQDAFRQLGNMRGRDTWSMPFYRHALDELAATRDPDLGTVAQRDPAFAARTLAAYTGLVDSLIGQSQAQFVADAREQLYFDYKIDNVLHAFAELQRAMPQSRVQIAGDAFRLAQLRSFGRLTLATLQAALAKSNIDPASRFDVERFFTLSTQTAVWLRALLDTLRIMPGSPPPNGDALWKAFFMLDVFYNETEKKFTEYVAFVRQQAPAVAELATPKPLPVREFQRRLHGQEAIVATLVTPTALYVWAVTSSGVTFARQKTGDDDVAAKVQRLRAGLVPGTANGMAKLPPFDAAAAFELYQLVFAPIEPALQGVTDVLWFGHGTLGAVPPAVLVPSRPPKPQLTTAADFAATKFLVDRYAFAALADLSLFPWHRDQPQRRDVQAKFLGVGAPLLSEEEVAGGARARSYDLAGGLDGKDLEDLPKLEESVDELRSMAAVAGEDRSTLWLGPDASEQKFADDRLAGYRTIALATHGFLPNEIRNVPEPALMLALDLARRDRFDGLLTSREIASLKLDADIVILSACNTAGSDGRPRAEAFTGLSQAFFTAGARALMVSHWPVMSGAAVQLSVGTLERAKDQKLSLARSLRAAMQAVRKDGAASAVESHPSYWAPFVIVGDGR